MKFSLDDYMNQPGKLEALQKALPGAMYLEYRSPGLFIIRTNNESLTLEAFLDFFSGHSIDILEYTLKVKAGVDEDGNPHADIRLNIEKVDN